MVRTLITGIAGRMGSTLERMVQADPELELVAGTERPGSPALQRPNVFDSLGKALDERGAQVVIDFTSAELSLGHARVCAEKGVPLVIGSTGFGPEGKVELVKFGQRIPMVMAPNMSVGVNVVVKLAAQLCKHLGSEFDVEISEAHHRMKKDAPSGTALRLAEEIASATGRSSKDFRMSREGMVGERKPNEIGITALRGGDVVGDHTVFFFGEGERVELTHRATSRDQFAKGALRAAKWVVRQAPGLYDMKDVLGL